MTSASPHTSDGTEPLWAAVFTPLTPQDPRVISGYLLRARIGAGGMGAVYLSYTPGGRPVALKVARAEFAADPEFRRRFEKEVTIAQRVQGLYTVPVIDCDPHAPLPWLATAYVPAPSLAASVARQGPLPAETVLVMIAGVAEALQSIHAAGVVHRDLKPGNVLLAEEGPRVIDFGISRAVESSSAALTGTGARIGTPAFMAPEQVQGKVFGTAGDVFTLGSTAYYAATGEYPFGGDAAVFHRILHEQPDWDSCPDQVRAVLEQCTRKDPASRPTPAKLIELCREASTDERLRIGGGWLPATVRADLTRYTLTAPAPSPSQARTVPGPPQPPAPWIPSPPSPRPSRSRALPWVFGALGAALLVVLVVVGILANLPNEPSGRENNGSSGTSPATAGTGSSGPSASAAPTTVDRYLSDSKIVQENVDSSAPGTNGSASVSGAAYVHSVRLPANLGYSGETPTYVEYDLGRHFQHLQTTVGLSDDATSGTVYLIEVFGDGRRLASHTVKLGDSVPVDINVTGVLRLRLMTTKVQADYWDRSVTVFGDAHVTGG
ncbi:MULTISPECIES: protein kinase domain-containing protein [unclassified Pseudofrankia]|uniref:protein kinase domain-containing protein n=1 Tax=unclassified Pseudofrankia TaxID=2994372 RepID=UPI0008DA6A98|nr:MULTISPECIES: protein kinase [unclassified Pseudofrankia]MDT3440888.1 protein kinase [Pseudofrankia sp. BMG5.37]OHV65763.1 serine/threonine protein kinase [Pseudofrankia sp. BMG5.36]